MSFLVFLSLLHRKLFGIIPSPEDAGPIDDKNKEQREQKLKRDAFSETKGTKHGVNNSWHCHKLQQ